MLCSCSVVSSWSKFVRFSAVMLGIMFFIITLSFWSRAFGLEQLLPGYSTFKLFLKENITSFVLKWIATPLLGSEYVYLNFLSSCIFYSILCCRGTSSFWVVWSINNSYKYFVFSVCCLYCSGITSTSSFFSQVFELSCSIDSFSCDLNFLLKSIVCGSYSRFFCSDRPSTAF